MYRCAIVAVMTANFAITAAAQMMRTFPQNALRSEVVFGEDRQIKLNGNWVGLSPGSRVRDQRNQIVLPATLAGGRFIVNYTLDIGETQVRDVWILTADEAAIKPWPRTLSEAQTWIYDTTTMTWSKP